MCKLILICQVLSSFLVWLNPSSHAISGNKIEKLLFDLKKVLECKSLVTFKELGVFDIMVYSSSSS